MQIIILLSLIIWSILNPTQNLALLISVGLIIAIASATQDITVDALRIEQIRENEGEPFPPSPIRIRGDFAKLVKISPIITEN